MATPPRLSLRRFPGVPSLAALIGSALLVLPAHAATLVDFDDLDAGALPTLASYASFTWVNVFAYPSALLYDAFPAGIVSGPNAAATFSGFYDINTATYTPSTSSLQSAAQFDFLSAHLGAAHLEGLMVTVEGVLNGNVVASQVVSVGTTGAQLFNFNFANINEVRFTAGAMGTSDPFNCGLENCQQVTLDNLSFASPVPEPAAWMLGLAGLVVISTLVRKNR